MGDSITAVRVGGANELQTFCTLIAKARNCGSWVNAGFAGDTTPMMISRFATEIQQHRPSIFGLMGGANDMTANITNTGGVETWTPNKPGNIPVATSKANLKFMVQQMQAARSGVTLMTSVPVTGPRVVYRNNWGPLNIATAEVATETGCQFIDIYTHLLNLYDANPSFYSNLMLDEIHPNAAGHAYIANYILANFPNAFRPL